MSWLYRLQQRLAITRNEAVALFTLLALLGAGLVARHLQQQPDPSMPDAYVVADSQFAAGVEAVPGANRTSGFGDAPREAPATRPSATLNLNAAESSDLRQLPGIGPALSQRIVAYREANGPFPSVEAITEVQGIGAKTLERLEPLLSVQAADTTTTDLAQAERE